MFKRVLVAGVVAWWLFGALTAAADYASAALAKSVVRPIAEPARAVPTAAPAASRDDRDRDRPPRKPSAASTVLYGELQPESDQPVPSKAVQAINLQSAVDAASRAGGGTVLVPAGRWAVTRTLNLWTNITLRGTGQQSCLSIAQPGIDVINVAGSNVTVADLCLIGPGGMATYSGNGLGRGVVNQNRRLSLDHVTVIGIWVYDMPGMGIELYGSEQGKLREIAIEGNVIRRTGGHGIAVGFASGGRVSGNLIDRGSIGGLAYTDGAIDIEGCSSFTIDSNLVTRSMAAGIQANNLDWSIVTNNAVRGTRGGSGFVFWNSTHDIVKGNTSTGNDRNGFSWALNLSLGSASGSSVIHGNVAQGNGANGFQLYQQTNVQLISNVAIDNNAAHVGASGVTIQQWSAGISLTANDFRNTSAAPGGQIYGVATPDHTTRQLTITGDNTFFQMAAGNIQQ